MFQKSTRTWIVCLTLVLLGAALPPAFSFASETPFISAALLETHEFEPCDENCMFGNRPQTAYCIVLQNKVIVANRAGVLWIEESNKQSLRNQTGRQVLLQDNGKTLKLQSGDRTTELERGTKFENFEDSRCRAEVHKTKIAEASTKPRPSTIPVDTVAIAGNFQGDYRPDFIWMSCMAGTETIDCSKWYPDGKLRGIEHYCFSVTAPDGLQLDQVASVEGKLVLSNGTRLQFDHRGRANDKLMDSAQPCN